jgi:hypothetical protein
MGQAVAIGCRRAETGPALMALLCDPEQAKHQDDGGEQKHCRH